MHSAPCSPALVSPTAVGGSAIEEYMVLCSSSLTALALLLLLRYFAGPTSSFSAATRLMLIPNVLYYQHLFLLLFAS